MRDQSLALTNDLTLVCVEHKLSPGSNSRRTNGGHITISPLLNQCLSTKLLSEVPQDVIVYKENKAILLLYG